MGSVVPLKKYANSAYLDLKNLVQGKLEKVEVVLGKNVVGGPFQSCPVPNHLDWNAWQGQADAVPYVPERSHYTFRWWLDYSGGQLTDWGAHHVDIAQWAITIEQGALNIKADNQTRLEAGEQTMGE